MLSDMSVQTPSQGLAQKEMVVKKSIKVTELNVVLG
jgi:hypothetical protein